MAETASAGPRLAAAPEPDGKDGDGPDRLGRVLDVAGIVAAGLLVFMTADVLTKGRLTGWLLRRRGPGGCADCGDKEPDGDS